METNTKIATQNKAWGFFGTISKAGVADAENLFDATARELIARFGFTADEARMVLDDRIGRHMGDQHQDGEGAASLIARLIQQGWSKDLRRAAGHQDAPRSTKELLLRVKPDEVAVLRFALDHALHEISEAHPDDRATIKALIERLEAAEKKVRR